MRWLLAGSIAMLSLASHAVAQTRQQALVDRATLAVGDMLDVPSGRDRLQAMRQARAVMVCPQVFRAGFVLAGAGGNCVLVARDGAGSWSAPAFYVMGSGSVGFQIGIQDSEIIMVILTNRGLNAIMDSQFKLGADASVAIANMGSGVEGDTTAALRADIVAYSQTRGLFAGVALNGSILTSDTAWNRAYYGADLAARQIVMQMQVNNAGANPLRTILGRFGNVTPRGAGPMAASGFAPAQPAYTPADAAPYTPEPRGSVSQQALPPVGH